MTGWKDAIAEGLVSGTLGAALATGVLMLAGRREGGSAVAPINAVSHWVWGEEAARDESVDARHTAVGAVTQLLAGIFWGTLHAKLRPRVSGDAVVPAAIAGALATGAVAATVDYGLIPKRLTPGWELRLSNRSVAVALVAMAAGIALGTIKA
jgi:hypothetical protein